MLKFDLAHDLWYILRPGFILNGGTFVKQAKETSCARDGFLNVRPKQRVLLNGLIETLYIPQERHDQAKGDRGSQHRLAFEHEPPAGPCDDRQSDISEGFQGRGKCRGKRYRADICIAVGSIDFLEILKILIPTTKGLNFAYRCDALLQLGIDVSDLLATLAEGLACLVREIDRRQEHDGGNCQGEQGEGNTGGEHIVGNPD